MDRDCDVAVRSPPAPNAAKSTSGWAESFATSGLSGCFDQHRPFADSITSAVVRPLCVKLVERAKQQAITTIAAARN